MPFEVSRVTPRAEVSRGSLKAHGLSDEPAIDTPSSTSSAKAIHVASSSSKPSTAPPMWCTKPGCTTPTAPMPAIRAACPATEERRVLHSEAVVVVTVRPRRRLERAECCVDPTVTDGMDGHPEPPSDHFGNLLVEVIEDQPDREVVTVEASANRPGARRRRRTA